MATAGDKVYQVSGSGEVSRRIFATRGAAERYLREEVNASYDERVGWHSTDERGNIDTYYTIDELTLG